MREGHGIAPPALPPEAFDAWQKRNKKRLSQHEHHCICSKRHRKEKNAASSDELDRPIGDKEAGSFFRVGGTVQSAIYSSSSLRRAKPCRADKRCFSGKPEVRHANLDASTLDGGGSVGEKTFG